MAPAASIRIIARVLWTLACGAVPLSATRAVAAPTRAEATADVDAQQRILVAQLTADKAITVARERRIADADEEALHERLAFTDRELRAYESKAAATLAELSRVRKGRAKIAEQRDALVETLAERDRALAAEVRAFRAAVSAIAASPDPGKREALQRFADGEQRQALAELDVIADANRKARRKAADIAEAAERRPIAALASQARDQGKQTLEELVTRYEELTRLDPGVTWDAIELSLLYKEQGRLAEAAKAADRALALVARGSDARERVASLSLLGHLAMQAGDLERAKARFAEGLVIVRKLAKAEPGSADNQHGLSIALRTLGEVSAEAGDLKRASECFEESLVIAHRLVTLAPDSAERQHNLAFALIKAGDVATLAGNLDGARQLFEESLVIHEQLAQGDPTSVKAQHDLSTSIDRLGHLALLVGDLPQAEAHFEQSLLVQRKWADHDPTSATARRRVSTAMNQLGDVAEAAGELARAEARYAEGLRFREQLAKDNPGSALAQHDLAASLEKLGDVAMQNGDLSRAKLRFEQSLPIVRKLAKDNPSSALAQRDLVVSLTRMFAVTAERRLLVEALEITRALDRTGRLATEDRVFLERLPAIIDALP